ncbi:MAG: SET domain-containing protein [Nanobdellota archaeon]
MKIAINKSGIEGHGLFANQDINKGDCIGTVEGPLVPDTQQSYDTYGEDHLHPISLTHAIVNQSLTRYTNHSCEPNAGLKDGLSLVAMRDITKGEEITIDYDTLEYEWEMDCNCQSTGCRKKLRGYKFLSPALKKRYKGFIAPYLKDTEHPKGDKNLGDICKGVDNPAGE